MAQTDNSNSPEMDGVETGPVPGTSNLDASANAQVMNGFHLIEHVLLIVIALLTLGAVVVELYRVWQDQTINLSDILLMFLYTEVIGMIAVFYSGRGSPYVYPIFIAITALARLIVLQGKEMAPQNIVFEAGAILLLALAATVMVRMGKN